MPLPVLITTGDPSGIGPEITLKSWSLGYKNIVIMGNIPHLKDVAKKCSIDLNLVEWDGNKLINFKTNECNVININWPEKVVSGIPNVKNAPEIINSIKKAVKLVKKNIFSGIVTNPVSKSSLYSIGFKYPGQTEFLSKLDKNKNIPVMLLMNNFLKAVPLTTHIPINSVEKHINTEKITKTLVIIKNYLENYFNINNPKIAICGLNPHAGESGEIGDFEKNILIPLINKLKRKNFNLFGPLAADSLFHLDARSKYDLILAMYHDQALIPVKTLDFYNSVNLTLGLSFVRTSPDHGTAFNIANTFSARPDSMIAAIKLVNKINKFKDV